MLAPSQSALLTDGEEVTEVDRVLFDTEPGAENLVQIEEDESTAVMVTKLRLGEHGDQEATPEEVELANALGVFALDLGDERTSKEAAASTKNTFKRVEELTPEELQKNVIYTIPRGSVGIQNMMREMTIEKASSEPTPAPVPSKAAIKGGGPKAAPPLMKLESKAPPAPPQLSGPASSSAFMRPTEVVGKSSAQRPVEPIQPPPPKRMPTAKPASEASPPGRDGSYWIKGTDLPPLSEFTRPMSGEKKETLSRKMTFILRGFTNKPEYGDRTPTINLRPGDLSADWEEFLDALSQIWRGLRVSEIMEVFKNPTDGKARYEVFIHRRSDSEFDVLRVRAVHGHAGQLLSDNVDILDTHQAVHTFVPWDASLATRPKITSTAMFCREYEEFLYKLGYHGTFRRNFVNIIQYGLLPGGMSLHESGSRAFVMLSPMPEWQRQDNAGLREKAEIEFVIDLQMAVRDGLRLLETRSGALETPDWISNKYIVYVYQRGSAEPIWVNPVYNAFRVRIDKALKAFREKGEVAYTYDPVPESLYDQCNCFLDLLDSTRNDVIQEWGPKAIKSDVPLYISGEALEQVGEYPIERPRKDDLPADDHNGGFGLCMAVWPSQEGRKVRPNARREPKHWIKQELIGFPGFFCSSCQQPYVDGMVECMVCKRRFAEITDLAIMAEPDRVRRLAAREGRRPSIADLQPSTGLSRQRVRDVEREGGDTKRIIQSTASTIRQKVVSMQRTAEVQKGTTPLGRYETDPLQAHNFARAGLSFYTVEALQRFASVRLPNPKGKGKGRGSSTYYDTTGKLALQWVPGQQEIDLLTECLVCFHDRFYTIDEIAVLIKAVKVNQFEFSILQFDGEKHFVLQTEILPIMGELARLIEREIPKSRGVDERNYPRLVSAGPLAVPPGAEGLGNRQLNELLANTPDHVRREYYMDTRIGRSEFARQRLTTSAPAQERRPPPPPAVPSPRRGRSSDERAETQSADRNRTRSPIARNRPAQTTIRTSGSAFLGDRPNEP